VGASSRRKRLVGLGGRPAARKAALRPSSSIGIASPGCASRPSGVPTRSCRAARG
jgi:hypothetical protein